MPRRHDGLFGEIASFQALIAAARRAVRGKRKKPGAAAFMANLETEALRIERELTGGHWRPGGYVTIRLSDPKPRLVSAAPFRDRVVHHALCRVIEPLFERGFVAESYANRRGKGTHRALARYERHRDRFAHVLRCDIHRYFAAIDHEVLKRGLRRRIACERTLRLCDRIIDGSNPQEPVELYFPGDDLFAPFERRRGLPLGNLTSQFFANLYLDPLDHFVKEVLGALGYVRYVDDFALFHDDPAVLDAWRGRIAEFLNGRRLILSPAKTGIAPTSAPATFLGYVTLPERRRRPEDNIRRFRNRLRGLRDRWRAGSVGPDEVEARVAAWIAHANHAESWRLRHAIFRGGAFAPPGGLAGPLRVVRGGSWNNQPRNLRAANRNRNEPDNRNNNLGFRVSSTLTGRSRPVHGPAGRVGKRPGPAMMIRPSADRWRRCPAPVLARDERRAPGLAARRPHSRTACCA